MENMATKSEEEKPFFLKRNDSFGVTRPEDDLLHPQDTGVVKDDTLTETQYFGFDVAEEGIKGLGYLWMHPNLQTASGGLWVFQGTKSNQLASEVFDFRTFMHERVITNDLHDYRLPNSYGVRIIELMKRHYVTYSDPVRKNSIDIEYTAVADPVMYGSGKHFDQPMKALGEVVLSGKRFEVDCYNVRDRSWGSPRPETLIPMPPAGWTTGVFGPDFSFACTVFDSPELMPEWGGKFAVPDEHRINGGWIYRDGKLGLITRCHKRTARDPGNLYPTAFEMEITDDHGRTCEIVGTVVSCNHWMYISNMRNLTACVRWECGGRMTYGEVQEGQFPDFIRTFMC